MPSRREDLENLFITDSQKPQSAEWEIGKPSLQRTVIYLAIIIFLGLGMFWRWSNNLMQVKATATAEVQKARSITATVQAAEATQQVEATAQARTTKMAEAVSTAVEAIIVEIRATATALAAETPKSSPHPLINSATPTDLPYVEKLPHDQ